MNNENQKTQSKPVTQALSDPAVPPTMEEMHKALDDLHITCECADPDIRDWYVSDPFAKEARQNAIDILSRYFYSQNNEDRNERGCSHRLVSGELPESPTQKKSQKR